MSTAPKEIQSLQDQLYTAGIAANKLRKVWGISQIGDPITWLSTENSIERWIMNFQTQNQQLSETRENLKKFQVSNNSLRQKLEAAQSEGKELNRSIDKLRVTNTQYEKDLESKNEQITNLKKLGDRLRRQIGDLEEELRNTEDNADIARKEASFINSKVQTFVEACSRAGRIQSDVATTLGYKDPAVYAINFLINYKMNRMICCQL
jgi:predicted nuclease with TOPRIM domain